MGSSMSCLGQEKFDKKAEYEGLRRKGVVEMAEAKKATATVKVKKAPAPAEVKAAEAKAEVPAAEVKKEAPVKAAAAKKPAAKKAAPAKKAAAKKPAAAPKKAAAKKTVVPVVHFQFAGKSYTQEDLINSCKDVWKYDLGGKEEDIKSIELYVKPEENTTYYVINGDVTGSFFI